MKEEDKQKIINFFSGDLSKKEKEDFIEIASSEKEFVNELVKMTELNEVFEDTYGFSEKKCSKRKVPIIRISIVIGAAAAIIFGLFFGIHQRQINSNPGAALFEKYYEPFDLNLTRSIAPSNTYVNLYSLYVREEYESLRKIDIEILDIEDIKGSAYVMQGISAIEMGDFTEARVLFHSVDDDSKFGSVAKWYLLLLDIQENIFDNVIPRLEDCSSNNLIFMGKANELIAILKKKNLVD